MKQDFNIRKINVPRDYNTSIQLLKFILSIFVVFFHVFLPFHFLNPLIIIPVNLFAIISGYLLVLKTNDYRAIKFLPTLLFLWIFNILLNLICSLCFNFYEQVDWSKVLVSGNNWSWWYLSAITIVYILSPFLNYIILKTNKNLLLLIILLMWISFEIFNYFIMIDVFWILPLFYCYLIGGFINIYLYDFIQLKKRLIYLITLGIFAVAFTLNTLHLLVWKNNTILALLSNTGTTSATNIFIASALFSTFLTFKIKKHKWINFLGEISLFIYAYHIFFYFNFSNFTLLPCNNNLVIFFVLFSTLLLSIILYFPFLIYRKYTTLLVNAFLIHHSKKHKNYLIIFNCLLFFTMCGFYALYYISQMW